MPVHVKSIEFLGEQAIQVENDLLTAILVPSFGSNIISLTYKKKNLALLCTPKTRQTFLSKPLLYGIPILFPPNRIENGKFTYANRTYVFDLNEVEKQNHIHGFVHDKPWKRITLDLDSVVTKFESRDHPEVERQFPHRFTMEMAVTLQDNKLIQKLTVTNCSSTAMPFGLGYHTSFIFHGNASVKAPISKRWILNERNLPAGTLEDADSAIHAKHPLDDVFLVEPSVKNELTIMDELNRIKIQYLCDKNFTQWVIYNHDGKRRWICTEPYTWVTNAPNLDLPYSLTGFQDLEPGASKICQTEIQVSDIPGKMDAVE